MRDGIIAIIGACFIFGTLGGIAAAIYESDTFVEAVFNFGLGFIVAVTVTLSLVAVVIGLLMLSFGIWTVAIK